jgi:2-methylcitrate dehydratase PrpD
MNARSGTPGTLSAQLAEWAVATREDALPEDVAHMVDRLLLDVAGLCVAARGADYVAAILAATEAGGQCTALGHEGGRNMYDAALINGTAAHGEDFDDTFEGGPIHSSAVIMPAVLAVCERFGRSG